MELPQCVPVREDLQIAEELKKTGANFYTGHCTGQAAYDLMKPILGERLHPVHSKDVLIS